MDMSQECEGLIALNDNYRALGVETLSLAETVATRVPVLGRMMVVPLKSANPECGEFVPIKDASHFSICKPTSRDDTRYRMLCEFVRGVCAATRRTGIEDFEVKVKGHVG
jgi:hypothetical protein